MATVIVGSSGNCRTISQAIQSKPRYIHIQSGVYQEQLQLREVTIRCDSGVHIDKLTVHDSNIYGGHFTNLTCNGKNKLRDVTISGKFSGSLHVSDSRVIELIGDGDSNIFNSNIVGVTTMLGGSINISNCVIYCPTDSSDSASVLNVSNTLARVTNNTIISTTTNFIAYTATNNSLIKSSNNTFRVEAASPYVGSSITGSNLFTASDVWITPNNVLPARYTTPGTTGSYDANIDINGSIVQRGLYTQVVNPTGAYSTTMHDFFINMLAPGGDITLSTPPEDGQIIFIKNNSGNTLSINGPNPKHSIPPTAGFIYMYSNNTWHLLSNISNVSTSTSIMVNDTVYVDSLYGNNTTAQLNNPGKPAQTLEHAYTLVATSNTVIHVNPGIYAPVTGFKSNNFYFEPNTVVNWSKSSTLFTDTANIYGYGTFNLNNATGSLFNINGSTLEALEVSGTVSANSSTVRIGELHAYSVNSINVVNTTADISQITITNNDINFINLQNSTLTCDKLVSTSGLSGTNTNPIVSATASSVDIDKVLLISPRLFSQLNNSTLTIDTIDTVSVLVSGTGYNATVGCIESNSIVPATSGDNSNLTIGKLITSVLVNTAISAVNMSVGTWILKDVSGGSYDLTNGCNITVGELLLTNVGSKSNPLFNVTGNGNLHIDRVSLTNSYLLNTAEESTFTSNITKLESNTDIEGIISLAGNYNIDIQQIQYSGLASLISVPNNNIATNMSTLNIGRSGVGKLLNIVNLAYNLSVHITHLVSTVTTAITHTGVFGSNFQLAIDKCDTVGANLISTNGYANINVSGRSQNTLANTGFVDYNCIGPLRLCVPNYSFLSTNAAHLLRITGSTIPSHLSVNLGNITYSSKGSVINAVAVTSQLDMNVVIQSIQSDALIFQLPCKSNSYLNINDIVCTNSILNVDMDEKSKIRLAISNGNVTTSSAAVVVSGCDQCSPDIGELNISIGNLTLTSGGSFLSQTNEHRVFLDARFMRVISGKVITLNSAYGCLNRVSGKYSLGDGSGVNTPAFLVNAPATTKSITATGIRFEFIEVSGSSIMLQVASNVSTNQTLTYKFIADFGVFAGNNNMTITGSGNGIFNNNLNSAAISKLLLN